MVLSRPDAEQLTLLVRVIAARNLVEREDTVLPAANVYVVRDPGPAAAGTCVRAGNLIGTVYRYVFGWWQALHIVPDDELQTTAQTRVCTTDVCDPVFNDTFTFKVTPRQLSESRVSHSPGVVGRADVV